MKKFSNAFWLIIGIALAASVSVYAATSIGDSVSVTNNISAGGTLSVTGSGTSTFSGGLSSAGLASSNGLTLSGGTSYFAGNVGIGTASLGAKVVISGNTASLPAPVQGSATGLQIGGADGGAAAALEIDGFGGGAPQIFARGANGTAASPSALKFSGYNILQIIAGGYGTSAYATNAANISMLTAQGWTNSAHGSEIRFGTTQNGFSSASDKVIISNAGRLGIGTMSPSSLLHVTAGANATTTANFGEVGDATSHACFNTKNTAGADISFYFVGTTMVVENNSCR